MKQSASAVFAKNYVKMRFKKRLIYQNHFYYQYYFEARFGKVDK